MTLIQAMALGAAGGNIVMLAFLGELPPLTMIAGFALIVAGAFAS